MRERGWGREDGGERMGEGKVKEGAGERERGRETRPEGAAARRMVCAYLPGRPGPAVLRGGGACGAGGGGVVVCGDDGGGIQARPGRHGPDRHVLPWGDGVRMVH